MTIDQLVISRSIDVVQRPDRHAVKLALLAAGSTLSRHADPSPWPPEASATGGTDAGSGAVDCPSRQA